MTEFAGSDVMLRMVGRSESDVRRLCQAMQTLGFPVTVEWGPGKWENRPAFEAILRVRVLPGLGLPRKPMLVHDSEAGGFHKYSVARNLAELVAAEDPDFAGPEPGPAMPG